MRQILRNVMLALAASAALGLLVTPKVQSGVLRVEYDRTELSEASLAAAEPLPLTVAAYMELAEPDIINGSPDLPVLDDVLLASDAQAALRELLMQGMLTSPVPVSLSTAVGYTAQPPEDCPGGGEHTGLYAVDLLCAHQDQELDAMDISWVKAHAPELGFAVTVTSDGKDGAPARLHLLYTGKPHAQVMTAKGLSLSGYADYLRKTRALLVVMPDDSMYHLRLTRSALGTEQAAAVPVTESR